MLKETALKAVDALAGKIMSKVGPTRLVVGLSGGADSTLVLILAHRIRELDARYGVLAVHCIHGLDADDPVWFNHCTRLCASLDIELKTPKLNIIYGGGKSPEEVSRAERYRALLENLNADSVLMLGHQADDQIESFLLALKRGSGPYGLSGMRFMVHDERGTIIRPLLELHKAEIIEIIEALGFTHVFDISNTYMKFERNFIRLKVLPLLRTRFAGVDGAILRSSKLCSLEHDLALRYAKSFYDRAFDKTHLRLDITSLPLDDEALMPFVLRLFMCEVMSMPPEFNEVQTACNLCLISPDQHVSLPLENGYELKRFKNSLYLVKERSFKADVSSYMLRAGQRLVLGDYTYSLVEVSGDEEGFESSEVLLDFEYTGSMKLKPASRVHSREIKKLFSEYAVPSWERQSKCLVREGHSGEVLALGDLFVTSYGKAASGTRKYFLKIS